MNIGTVKSVKKILPYIVRFSYNMNSEVGVADFHVLSFIFVSSVKIDTVTGIADLHAMS